MKYPIYALLIICLTGCESSEDKVDGNLTGREKVYTLYQGSDYNISGMVTFKETKTQSAVIIVALSGTEKELWHPVHLHFGGIAENGNIAAVLNPIDGASGISSTTLESFRNTSEITYQKLLETQTSVKVHLSDTDPDKNIILAAGNIGTAYVKENPFGRVDIAVCKSN